MAVQQNKVSKQKCRQRRGANQYKGVNPGKCATCGADIMPHRVCSSCGTYAGRQVLTVKSEE